MPDLATLQAATPRCPHVAHRLNRAGQPTVSVVCDQPMRSEVNDVDGEHWRCPRGHTITWAELVEAQNEPMLEAA